MPAVKRSSRTSLLKVGQAAAEFGVAKSNIRAAIAHKQVRAIRVGTLWFVPRSDVERLFQPILNDD